MLRSIGKQSGKSVEAFLNINLVISSLLYASNQWC